MSTVAVAGGTGVIGRPVVAELSGRGHDVRVLARAEGVDLTTGAGLDEALEGVEVVVDAVNVASLKRSASVEFFEATTRALLAAGERAGVRHHLALSIVGCDRVDLGYYFGKRRQESLVELGPVPWTILRATQFHEFAGQLIDRSPGPLAMAPQMLSQPIAAAELAGIIADFALGEPAGRAPDVGGPERHRMHHLVRRVARRRGARCLVVPLPMLGKLGRQVTDGGLLPRGEDAILGQVTFDEWLGG